MGARKWNVAIMVIPAVVLPCTACGEVICWTADRSQRIQCAQPDGTAVVDVLQRPGRPMGMALDPIAQVLFWAEQEPNRIMSLDLSGGANPQILVELPIDVGLRGMAVAASIGKIYWTVEDLGKIQRADYDGTNVEDLPIAPGSFFDVQVDDTAGTLYWTDGAEIFRGNLNGTAGVPIIGDAEQPYYLALDLAAGKIYWTDFNKQEIGRANLDGSDREIPGPIADLPSRPIGITMSSELSKVYWTLESGTVQRANLDGTGVETILDGLESTWDITVLASTPVVESIPAASTWGLIVLALGLLATGSIVAARGNVAERDTI